MRNIRQDLARNADAVQVGRVVQRGQRDEILDHRFNLILDELRFREEAAAVHDAVSHGDDIDALRSHLMIIHQVKGAL